MQTLLVSRGFSGQRVPLAWSRKAYVNAARKRWAAVAFSGASQACAAGSKLVTASGGGGPTTTPTWRAAGTGSNATSNPTPAYGTNVAGDLFVLNVYCNSGSCSTPSGWTLQASATDGIVTVYSFTRDTRSTGGESGTVAVTGTGGPIMARIHAFADVATSSFTEGAASATSGSMPSVVCGGTHRLAICAQGSNDNGGVPDSTGETGGDWAQPTAASTSGLGAEQTMQIADMSSGGTISGGSITGGSRIVMAAYALIGT